MSIFNYPSVCFRQRDTAKIYFCLLSAPVGQVLQWARVDRLQPDNVKGVQRKKNESRERQIRAFFQADDANTIPTAITVALPFEATNFKPAKLDGDSSGPISFNFKVKTLQGKELPGLIIDGQHRTFGIDAFDPATRISVVFVLGADDAEIAFQFLVINNKVSKVSPDHIKALRLAYIEDQLDARLTKSARMRSTGAPTYLETIDSEDGSPFKGRLRWPRNPEHDGVKLIPPNAFETALLHVSSQDLVGGDRESRNYDTVVDIFLQVWEGVQEEWGEAWSDPDSRLLSKLGIICMSQYLVDGLVARVEASEDITSIRDLDYVRLSIKNMLQRQEYRFWTAPWSASSLDTSAGREIVIKDLRKIAINKRSGKVWSYDLALVESFD